jgi:hypothetical protein
MWCSFTLELAKMLVEEIVGDRDHPVVPGVPVTALVAADQQDRGSPRIERAEVVPPLAELVGLLDLPGH